MAEDAINLKVNTKNRRARGNSGRPKKILNRLNLCEKEKSLLI